MINTVIMVGRLTRDPELRQTGTNISVANFTLAVNRPFKSQDGQDADFIKCQTWRKQAENLGKYTKKGDMIGVEGRIQTRNFEGNDGETKYITEVVADRVQFLSTKQSSANQKPEKEVPPMPTPPTEEDLPF